MRILPPVLFFLGLTVGISAQTPQSRLSYEDRAGTAGHTLVVEGKTLGPYKEISSVTHSTSGVSGLFLVTRKDKTYIVAQGKESGPLGPGFESDQTHISDDGKVAAVTAIHYDDSGQEGSSQTQLWVNGKLYGPYLSVPTFEFAETGGGWVATVQTSEDEYSVLLNGKTEGPFSSVEHIWMFPDSKGWGYAGTDSDGKTSVVTQDQTYENIQNYNFDQMYPRSSHWGMGFQSGDQDELIVVDGKVFQGYRNFSGLTTTYSGHFWGFEAEKLDDAGDYPVVVINGKEYLGEELATSNLGDKEFFTWTVRDGSKVSVQVLTLP